MIVFAVFGVEFLWSGSAGKGSEGGRRKREKERGDAIAVLFLASDAAAWISGVALVLDGGRSAG